MHNINPTKNRGRPNKLHLCKECGEADPNNFYNRSKNVCKPCAIEKNKRYYILNKDKISNRYKNNKHLLKENNWKYQGIEFTVKKYNEMLYSQQLRCAACDKYWELDESVNNRDWPVDHCHITGRIRGIICDPCNKILGFAKDSIEILESVISYLEKFGEV